MALLMKSKINFLKDYLKNLIITITQVLKEI